jgi:hypothetical protein
MNNENKNLVLICFPDKENKELLNTLENLKKDYNFELDNLNFEAPIDYNNQYLNKILIMYADNDHDLNMLHSLHIKFRNKLKQYKIILASSFDCCQWVTKLEAEACLIVRNINYTKNQLEKIFNEYFQNNKKIEGNFETNLKNEKTNIGI